MVDNNGVLCLFVFALPLDHNIQKSVLHMKAMNREIRIPVYSFFQTWYRAIYIRVMELWEHIIKI